MVLTAWFEYITVQVVRAAGLRAVKQKLCFSSADVTQFCGELSAVGSSGGFKCVVKPNESAGTDSVFLCHTPEEVQTAFSSIHGHSNGLGHENNGALCQEFLSGTEFVIDGVSRDGVYKVMEINICNCLFVCLYVCVCLSACQ